VYCGGELISPFDNEAIRAVYVDSDGGSGYQGVPSDIAHGWLDLEKPFKAWFGVGAHPILFDYPREVEIALSSLDHLCVRGTVSKIVLEGGLACNNGGIRVMPDLGWVFPPYIEEYLPHASGLVNELGGQRYAAFEAIDDKDIGTDTEEIADCLVSFQESMGVKVVLVPIIQTKRQWFEQATLRKIRDAAEGKLTLLPAGESILETGAVLRNAWFFVGSSMHGAVTVLAYGKPAANIRGTVNTKLQDLHSSRFRSACFANGWDVLPGLLERLNNEAGNDTDRRHNLMYADYMRYRVSREIDGLCARIRSHCGC
jgi:hypothetical protein